MLLGGSPMRMFRLTEAGARIVDAIEAGRAVPESELVTRLLAAAAVHPARVAGRFFEDSASDAPTSDQVGVVMPVLGGEADELARRIRRVGAVGGGIVVVDDASLLAVTVPEHVTLLRRDQNGGPGAARNTGLAAIETAFVAFVDADVELPDDWLAPLLAHFADPTVVAVAPRIVGRAGPGRLARYDHARSPLDLGPAGAPVRARTRVSYVPAAVLVARTDAVRAIGGFNEALRTGEDVDLVWRLTAAGGTVRYEPGVVVEHEPRANLTEWLRQRHGYGRSAAPLAQRHPGALAPVAVSGWSAASWTLAALGWPVVGAAAALGSTLALPRKLQGLREPVAEAFRIAGRGHLFAGRQLAAGITRAWWPLALVATLVSQRARRALALAVVVPALLDWRATRPELDPVTYTALRTLDDAAYGSGVWRGMAAERTLAPIRPDLSSWPGDRARRRRPRTPSPG